MHETILTLLCFANSDLCLLIFGFCLYAFYNFTQRPKKKRTKHPMMLRDTTNEFYHLTSAGNSWRADLVWRTSRVHGIITILFCYLKCFFLCNVHLGYKLNIFHDRCCSGWFGQLTTWSAVCSCHCLFGLFGMPKCFTRREMKTFASLGYKHVVFS